MTLRESFGGDVEHIHEQVNELLDKEDAVLVLFDGVRLVSYTQGFGVSPSQHELLSVEIERAIRNVAGKPPTKSRERRNRANREGHGVASDVHRARRGPAGRLLQLASKIA